MLEKNKTIEIFTKLFHYIYKLHNSYFVLFVSFVIFVIWGFLELGIFIFIYSTQLSKHASPADTWYLCDNIPYIDVCKTVWYWPGLERSKMQRLIWSSVRAHRRKLSHSMKINMRWVGWNGAIVPEAPSGPLVFPLPFS